MFSAAAVMESPWAAVGSYAGVGLTMAENIPTIDVAGLFTEPDVIGEVKLLCGFSPMRAWPSG